MSLWGRVFAAGYDRVMAGTERAGLSDKRRALLTEARGRVVEIGGGTGVNIPFYGPAVESVVFVEPEEPMAKRLAPKLAGSSVAGSVVGASAEELPFPDDCFDYAVCTLVLCTVANPPRALSEIRRVLKPDGTLLFLEHVRSDREGLARWQDRLNFLQNRIGHGCHCNRSTLSSIETAGFAVRNVEHSHVPKAPPILRPLIVGAATPS
jgi:ubiquinone/menaquinone biosynthesis C-methylase UbiE